MHVVNICLVHCSLFKGRFLFACKASLYPSLNHCALAALFFVRYVLPFLKCMTGPKAANLACAVHTKMANSKLYTIYVNVCVCVCVCIYT